MQLAQGLVVADENIPYVEEAFGAFGAVRRLSGKGISADAVRDADVLLVRSVTEVNRGLLDGSRVRFVGSTTIGTDHVDGAYLRERGIAFANAPGSNAESVVEYVLAALLWTAVRRGETLRGKTVGIVGYGNIGARLAARLPAFGVEVLKNDPLLAEAAGEGHGFVSLDDLLNTSDIVSLHVPLERRGPYATRHLIDGRTLGRMKPDAWLLNTCRGAVVDNAALREALQAKDLGAGILDVWEGEPDPDPELLRLVDVATPHIAGYSFDGKVEGTLMVYRSFLEHFGAEASWDPERVLGGEGDALALTAPDSGLPETAYLHVLARQMYDLEADDRRIRKLTGLAPRERGAYFNRLRKEYPRRRTFRRFHLPEAAVPEAYREAVRSGLLVQLT